MPNIMLTYTSYELSAIANLEQRVKGGKWFSLWERFFQGVDICMKDRGCFVAQGRLIIYNIRIIEYARTCRKADFVNVKLWACQGVGDHSVVSLGVHVVVSVRRYIFNDRFRLVV